MSHFTPGHSLRGKRASVPTKVVKEAQNRFSGTGMAAILGGHKKTWTIGTCGNVDEPQNNYTKWKKPDRKECDGHTPHPSLYLLSASACVLQRQSGAVSNWVVRSPEPQFPHPQNGAACLPLCAVRLHLCSSDAHVGSVSLSFSDLGFLFVPPPKQSMLETSSCQCCVWGSLVCVYDSFKCVYLHI